MVAGLHSCKAEKPCSGRSATASRQGGLKTPGITWKQTHWGRAWYKYNWRVGQGLKISARVFLFEKCCNRSHMSSTKISLTTFTFYLLHLAFLSDSQSQPWHKTRIFIRFDTITVAVWNFQAIKPALYHFIYYTMLTTGWQCHVNWAICIFPSQIICIMQIPKACRRKMVGCSAPQKNPCNWILASATGHTETKDKKNTEKQ